MFWLHEAVDADHMSVIWCTLNFTVLYHTVVNETMNTVKNGSFSMLLGNTVDNNLLIRCIC